MSTMTYTEARDAIRTRLTAALIDVQALPGLSGMTWPHSNVKGNLVDHVPEADELFLSPYTRARGAASISFGSSGGLKITERTLFIRIALPKGTTDDDVEPIFEALEPHFRNSGSDDLDFAYGDLSADLLPGSVSNNHFVAVASFPFAFFRT